MKKLLTYLILILVIGCSKSTIIIDKGDDIVIEFMDGLNDDVQFQVPKDDNGYYYLILEESGQTVQRISVSLSKNGYPIPRQKLEWSSNLYWWLLPGDIVANITRTYFNPYTGQIEYVNYPPLVNWKDQLVSTINPSSYTDEITGIGNTVIGMIPEMVGDTMMIKVQYIHMIMRKDKDSIWGDLIGKKIIRDSIQIVFK